MARFDVLMPVKDGAAYLSKAIASIQAQTVRDWRLLILDHGSVDDTLSIAQQAADLDGRIELRPFPTAPGLAGLLNEGLGLVTGEFAMRMDADDESLPHRMESTARAFAAHPDALLVGGQATMVDSGGAELGAMNVPCDPGQIGRTAMFRNPVIHPTVTFRTRAVDHLRIRYGESRHAGAGGARLQMKSLVEDYLLFGELAIEGAVKNIDEVLLRYRFHSGGVGRKKFEDQIRMSVEVSRHLAFLLASRAGQPRFDPAPFCSHGETLVDVGEKAGYRDEFERLSRALLKAGGVWEGAGDAIAWRRVYVDRRPLGLAWRALSSRRAAVDAHELRTVRNAIRSSLRGRTRINVATL